MYTAKKLTFFYALTPVHMGAGQALGVIDNPIQRERHTEHPSFAGSGIKGALRHAARGEWSQESNWVIRVFGPDTQAADHAGAVSFTDAQLVAFPVRSLKQVFVYATSPLALQRVARLASVADVDFPVQGLTAPEDSAAVVANDKLLVGNGGKKQLILESFAFDAEGKGAEELKKTAKWLADHIFPKDEAFDYFRKKLETDLVLLSDNQLTYFARNATTVEPHVRIDDETGTAQDGGLFFTENLPPESLMVSLAMASEERLKKGSDTDKERLKAEQIMGKLMETFDQKAVQIGGDATTGRGQVLVRFVGGAA